ncbi:cytochrome P450 [Fusarium albosuccineum]|uniref:Cytochrome P450 n=1 Tax=Fusarium albosuccineum TaxID=1237068 RepID=A0A8H4LA00_9HYPO|nr:cytochrome P450 [Fusarium albosuccineum]
MLGIQDAVVVYGAVAFLFLLVVNTFLKFVKSPIRYVPGPWYTHFTQYVLKFKTLAGQRMHYVHSLHAKYGPIVRISPRQVAVADVDGFTKVHRIGSGFIKTQWYEDFIGGVDKTGGIGVGLFAMRDPKEHARRRKMFARAFSTVSLRQNCEGVVREKVDQAVSRIREEASRGSSDILKWWMLMTSDVIGQLSFGEPFGLLEAGKKNHYIEVLEATALGTTIQYELPWLYQICRYIPHPAVQLIINASGLVNSYGSKAAANLYRNSDNKANLFATMLAESEASEKSQLTAESIRCEASNFIVAGADTTSNTLTYIIWSILKHPDLHTRLQAELDSVGDVFDDARLEKLPLLNAVIEETLRLYGAVPSNLSRVVPQEGASFGEYFIPGGFEVETQAYTLHRNPDVFPDPLRFDEKRWLNSETLTPQQKTSFCPFGAGTRTCIGVHLARMELRLGTAALLKACPGLKLSSEMKDSMMDMYNFFLAGPVGKRCEVTMK